VLARQALSFYNLLTEHWVVLAQIAVGRRQSKTKPALSLSVLITRASLAAFFLLLHVAIETCLQPDMNFKMPCCQNIGDPEVGDPKLATRKNTTIGEIGDYRWWEFSPLY
jgi:hypothetical protein